MEVLKNDQKIADLERKAEFYDALCDLLIQGGNVDFRIAWDFAAEKHICLVAVSRGVGKSGFCVTRQGISPRAAFDKIVADISLEAWKRSTGINKPPASTNPSTTNTGNGEQHRNALDRMRIPIPASESRDARFPGEC